MISSYFTLPTRQKKLGVIFIRVRLNLNRDLFFGALLGYLSILFAG